ncbi:uncharacterized protein LOC144289824 [Canis aureus]
MSVGASSAPFRFLLSGCSAAGEADARVGGINKAGRKSRREERAWKITKEVDFSYLTANHPLKEKLERNGNNMGEQRLWSGVCSGWPVRTCGHIPFLSQPSGDTHPSPTGV